MKKPLIMLTIALTSIVNAKTIAQCGETTGYSYYPAYNQAKTLKEKAAEQIIGRPITPEGWVLDGFKNSTFTLVQNKNGSLDLIIYNTPRNETFSTAGDGGKLYLVRNNHEEIVVVSIYDSLTEVYTFLKTKEGNKISILSSKNSMSTRTSMFTGSCNFVNFSGIK
jgi:hypothetical protein